MGVQQPFDGPRECSFDNESNRNAAIFGLDNN